MFDSDGQDPDGQFPEHFGQLISPVIRATNQLDRVYLKFYQYYRNFNSDVLVEVFGDTDNSGRANAWVDVTAQALRGANSLTIGQNVETGNGDLVVFDITALAAGVSGVQLRFTFSGSYYFWIIDDVTISDQNPFPTTYPPSLGEELLANGYGYEVDSLGGAYVPDQLLIYWKLFDTIDAGVIDTITEQDKQALHDQLGIDSIVVCPCDQRLELWVIDGRPGSPDPTDALNAIDIFGIKEGAKTASETLGTDNNYLNSSEIEAAAIGPNPPLTLLPPGIQSPGQEDVLLAVLDTGIDYDAPDLVKYIWKNEDGSDFGSTDSIGWNLADWNNNPYDNSPVLHGSNVSRVIHHTMVKTSCDFKILPVKTHDASGVSTLFSVTCGTFYAIKEGAKIINYSWGWSGAPNVILQIAVREAKNQDITILAAAGNDGLKIDSVLVYPACYPEENLLAVAALKLDTNGKFIPSPMSNYSSTYIDLATLGEDVEVLGQCGLITGTSYATPAAAAVAAFAYAEGTPGGKPVWEHLLSCGGMNQIIGLDTMIHAGRVLPVGETCLQ